MFTIVLLSNGQALRAQIYFHGRIVDSKQIPLSGVSCVLINLSDSTQIDGTASDLDGRFILTSKVDEEYLLQLSFIGYEKIRKICKSGNLGDIVLHEDAVLLDGMRRSTNELKMLKATDIKNIQYYSAPPARYAHENIGAVIDVKTKKRTEKLYSAYLDTKNGVTTGYGTDMVSLAYRDSLNMITAAYFIDYRALNDNRMNNNYTYTDKIFIRANMEKFYGRAVMLLRLHV